MKKKLLIILPVMLLLFGVVYKTVLAKPKPDPKVHGIVYVLPKEFLINLADGRFTKLSVALVLDHGMEEELAKGAEHAAPPEGYGSLQQEGLVRDLVTDTVTDAKAEELIDSHGRERLKRKVLKKIQTHTDVKTDEVLFTDVAVQ